MKNVIEYKGYFTSVEYSAEDKLLHGKIEGINDLVNFECEEGKDVERAFQEAVDDYLAFCEDTSTVPEKPYKGVFNVRLSPELHKKSAMTAASEHISLNQLVARAVEKYLAHCS